MPKNVRYLSGLVLGNKGDNVELISSIPASRRAGDPYRTPAVQEHMHCLVRMMHHVVLCLCVILVSNICHEAAT